MPAPGRSRSATPSASARRPACCACSRRWPRACRSNGWPATITTPTAWRWRTSPPPTASGCACSMPRSPASAAARMPRARPAMSRPRMWCTCCTAWARRPASIWSGWPKSAPGSAPSWAGPRNHASAARCWRDAPRQAAPAEAGSPAICTLRRDAADDTPPHRQTMQRCLHGRLRSVGSRCHCRVFAASMNASTSSMATTPASFTMPALSRIACVPPQAAIAFRWP